MFPDAFAEVLQAATAIESTGARCHTVRVSKLGVEGGPVTYLDKDGGVVLIHPRDWREVWGAVCRTPEFLPGTHPTTIYGIPVVLDGRVAPGRAVVK